MHRIIANIIEIIAIPHSKDSPKNENEFFIFLPPNNGLCQRQVVASPLSADVVDS